MSKPGEISAVFRPADAFRVGLTLMNPGAAQIPLGDALTQSQAMLELGDLLKEAFDTKKTSDGRIDSRDVAHFVLVKLKRVCTNLTPSMEERIEDDKQINGFAKLWTQAVEESLESNTPFNWYEIAARILSTLKAIPR